MKPISHFVASGLSAGWFYLYAKSEWAPSLVCFLSGILIDLDHFYDFFMHCRKWNLDLKEFYLSCSEIKFKKLYLVFHSVDLIFIFWLLILLLKLNLIWIAIAFGVSIHLLLDIIGNKNRIPVYSYFFLNRLRKNFMTEFLGKYEAD